MQKEKVFECQKATACDFQPYHPLSPSIASMDLVHSKGIAEMHLHQPVHSLKFSRLLSSHRAVTSNNIPTTDLLRGQYTTRQPSDGHS